MGLTEYIFGNLTAETLEFVVIRDREKFER